MTDTVERWLPVVGWEGLYEVSDLGKVRSLPRKTIRGVLGGRELRPGMCSNGYMLVALCQNGRPESRLVHHLVADAFIGPRPDGHQCCHNDGTRDNNALDNLRWDDTAGNQSDRVKHGTSNRGERSSTAKLTEAQVLEIRADPRVQSKIATEFGISRQNVSIIKRRINWAHLP